MIITIIKVGYLPYKSFDVKLTSCYCDENALMKWVIAKQCLSVFHCSDKYTYYRISFSTVSPIHPKVTQLA